jgi:hypothetical protein
MNRRRSHVGLVTVLAIVSTSACAYHPPHPGISISMSKVTADVLYGGAAAAVLPGALTLPPPPPAQPVPPTQYVPSPEPVRSAAPASKVDVCPNASSSVVEHPAVNRVVGPPVPATYPFRADQQISSAKNSLSLKGIAETRQVSKAVTNANTIGFAVTARFPFTGMIETTDYQIVTSSAAPSEEEGTVPVGTLSGVYVTGQTVTGVGGKGKSSVTWNPPTQVLKLPAGVGETWAVSSTDQATGAAESYTAKIVAVSQVNACGVLVQGYQVTMSGQLVTPGQAFPLSFTETEVIAPQFGGLVLADDATVTGHTSPTATATQHVTDTINVAPQLPAADGS